MIDCDTIVRMMIGDPTQEDCKFLFVEEWWDVVGLHKAAWLQLHQKKLCMPMSKFLESLSFALGRPVMNIELTQHEKLIEEFATGNSPTLQEVLDMLPRDKIVIALMDTNEN